MCPLVSPVWAQLPKSGRTDGRAESHRRSRHNLALGSALCTRTAPPLSPGAADDESLVACRRDLPSRRGQVDLFYRAVDSTGATIDFLLSAKRDAPAAKRFFQKALRSVGHPRPRVINVDGNPSYPKVIAELKSTGELGRRCRCRPIRYLNNLVEQDHRAIKRRVRASQGFRSFHSAARTIQGIETVNMIRKGQIRWLAKDDIAGQVAFVT